MVLMGSMGVPFEITEGLDNVWGFEGTLEHMKAVMGYFAYDKSLTSGDLAQARFEGATQPGFQASYSSMFPAPRQRWVESMTVGDGKIRALPHRTLIMHGREDQTPTPSTWARASTKGTSALAMVVGRTGCSRPAESDCLTPRYRGVPAAGW
jgi:hypothetical protein